MNAIETMTKLVGNVEFSKFLLLFKGSKLSANEIISRWNQRAAMSETPKWWNAKSVGKSANSQITYIPIKLAVKHLNDCLLRDDEADKEIIAPELRFELAAAGFDQFSKVCCDFRDEWKRLEWVDASGDFHFINAHINAEGKPCYSPKELLRAFEGKYAVEIANAKKNRSRKEIAEAVSKVKKVKAALGQVSKDTLKAIVAA